MATRYIVNNATGQTINGETIQRPYKVYTALLTQSGESNVLQITDPDSAVIGTTYTITTSGDSDFTTIGAPNNNVGTSFAATGTTVNWNTSSGILQFDTGAPVVTVLENTIGNIWFDYNNTGQYRVNSDSLFLTGKTYFSISDNTDIAAPSNFRIIMIGNPNNDYIDIITYDPILDLRGNNRLTNTPIEIRVYN